MGHRSRWLQVEWIVSVRKGGEETLNRRRQDSPIEFAGRHPVECCEREFAGRIRGVKSVPGRGGEMQDDVVTMGVVVNPTTAQVLKG